MKQGRYGEAMRWYEESLAIERRLGNQAGIATTLSNIGKVYHKQGRYDDAMRRFEESLAIERRLGNEAGIQRPSSASAAILDDRGRYDDAMRRYEESLAIFRRLGIGEDCPTLNNMAVLRYKQGKRRGPPAALRDARHRAADRRADAKEHRGRREAGSRRGVLMGGHQAGKGVNVSKRVALAACPPVPPLNRRIQKGGTGRQVASRTPSFMCPH